MYCEKKLIVGHYGDLKAYNGKRMNFFNGFSLSPLVIRARIVTSSFNNISQERKYLVKVKTVFRSLVEIKERQEIFVVNDYCHCPILLPHEQYIIMGTAEQISVTEFRLLIPPRPFVRIWNFNMEVKFKAIGDICDN